MNKLLIFAVLLLLLVLFFFRKKSKHQKNIVKSKQILIKLNSFEHNGQKINYLKKIDPFVFEELLLSAFKKKGFKIKRNDRYTGDGGIDGIIYDNQKNKYIIQAKRYSNYINAAHVREFGELLRKNNCKGFFIHTGKTGAKSLKDSYAYNMEIISGDKLIALIN